jgi:regulator of protease activity HflC (stomatin/prohibitin superfamily)
MDWEGLIVVSRTEGTFRSMISRCWLDELIAVDEDAEQAAREALQSELKAALDKKVPALGAKILDVCLGNLRVKDEITDQWIKAWKARWQRWSKGLLAQGEASHIYLYETAKAEAQMQLVMNIAQSLERQLAAHRLTPAMVNQIVLMRLFSVLDRASFAASSRIFFPAPAIEVLENMRQLLDRGDAQLPGGG